MGSRDTPKPFQLVLADKDVHQISVMENKLIVLIHDNKQFMLTAYALKSMIKAFNFYYQTHTPEAASLSLNHRADLDWCMIKRSSVICFAVGKIREQSVIVYLTKRLQTIWLVIIIPNHDSLNRPYFHHSVIKNHWYKKYRTVSVTRPTVSKYPTSKLIYHLIGI